MNTLTVELTEDLAGWLNDRAAKTGQTQEEIARAQLEEARLASLEKPWMKLVGCMESHSSTLGLISFSTNSRTVRRNC